MVTMVVCLVLLTEAVADPARTSGAHFRIRRPIQRASRGQKSKVENKRQSKGIRPPQYYPYQLPYDPTGHGDPRFSFFLGKGSILFILVEGIHV